MSVNKSYLLNELHRYFTEYRYECWKKDDDIMDGSFAMAKGGSSSKPFTAQGKESKNTKGSVVPFYSRREIVKWMDQIRQQAPAEYGAMEFVFSGTADEVMEQVNEARERADAMVEILCKRAN